MENVENEHDFPVISEGGPDDGPSLLERAAAGATETWDEDLYAAASESGFDRGPKIGTVTIVHWKGGTQTRIPFTAYFAFGDEHDEDPEIAVVTGFVPGNGRWRGRARVAYSTGTGRFAERVGKQLTVESENPKRWG